MNEKDLIDFLVKIEKRTELSLEERKAMIGHEIRRYNRVYFKRERKRLRKEISLRYSPPSLKELDKLNEGLNNVK